MFMYSVNLIWSEEDRAYMATVPEFPNLSAPAYIRAYLRNDSGLSCKCHSAHYTRFHDSRQPVCQI